MLSHGTAKKMMISGSGSNEKCSCDRMSWRKMLCTAASEGCESAQEEARSHQPVQGAVGCAKNIQFALHEEKRTPGATERNVPTHNSRAEVPTDQTVLKAWKHSIPSSSTRTSKAGPFRRSWRFLSYEKVDITAESSEDSADDAGPVHRETNWLMTLCSCGRVPAVQVQQRTVKMLQIQVPAIRRSGRHSNGAPTSDNPEGCRDDTGTVQGDERAIQKRMPNIQKIQKTVEITHAVTQGQVPNIAKTYEIPQAQFMPRRCMINSCAETVPNAQEIQIEMLQHSAVRERSGGYARREGQARRFR